MRVGRERTLWVTRHRIQVNRTAPAWLTRRFIDPKAELHFGEPERVTEAQQAERAGPGR